MNQIKVILSKKFSLIGRDYFRGLIIATLTAALVVFQAAVDTGSINWKQVGMAALAGGLGYLIKNGLLEPTKIITQIPAEKADPVVVTEEIKTLVS